MANENAIHIDTSNILDNVSNEQAEDIFFKADIVRATEKILEDKFVEDKIDSDNFPLWVIVSKSFKLTFFEQTDVMIQENLFEASVCKYLRSLPPSSLTIQESLKIDQARMLFHANLRRALGTTDRNKINERIAFLSQIKWVMGLQGGSGSGGGGGIRSKIGKALGFGGND